MILEIQIILRKEETLNIILLTRFVETVVHKKLLLRIVLNDYCMTPVLLQSG